MHALETMPLLAESSVDGCRSVHCSSAYAWRRIGGVGLIFVFGLFMIIGLVHVATISNEALAMLKQLQTSPQMTITSYMSIPTDSHPLHSEPNNATARVLIVYSDGTHLSTLAAAVALGVRAVVHNQSDLRIRVVEKASFEDDVLWADAIILGSHVINANVEPKMAEFLSTWSITADLSHKIGAVFVTGGGISSGEELTMVNLLHSMMIFRLIIVGGEQWTSAFGASAVVSEGPFQPITRGNPHELELPTKCYPTDPGEVAKMFKDKAFGLGRRVASIAAVLRQHVE